MGEERDASRSIPNSMLYCIMLAMLVSGTCNTIVMKWQDKTVAGQDKTAPFKDYTFNHPYFQCAVVFFGELTCLFVYFVKIYCFKSNEQKKEEGIPLSPGGAAAEKTQMKTKINPFLLLIPACFDICGSTLMFVALTQCAASVYQMMRGIIVVITAAMSIIFLGAKQYTHHWIALFMIVAGVAIVGVASVLHVDPDAKTDDGPATTVLGIVLLLAAQCFTGGQFIVEEKLLGGYYLDPFLVVGLEGFWGVCIWSILLPIFQTVKNCTFALCDPKTGTLEDTSQAIIELQLHPVLIAQCGFIIISIASFNATGVSITKFATAAQRSTVDTQRTLLIWIVSLAIRWEPFIWQEVIGFVLLVGGTFIYNEIVIVPIDFMSVNTKLMRANREGKAGRGAIFDEKDANYVATSPHAGYDNNRNKRAIMAAEAGSREGLIDQHQKTDKDGNMYINDYTTSQSSSVYTSNQGSAKERPQY